MPTVPFYLVDVFAEQRLAGNQLAVFADAANLSGEEMQQIAREINFSETTFILSSELRNGGYDVRIFTPKTELPFAGHPTLGTAYILRDQVIGYPVESIVLNLPVGQIPVMATETKDVLWMRQASPSFGATLSTEHVLPVLGLEPDDVDDRFPIQTVSTGVPFIIVPLKHLAALQRITINRDRYFELVATAAADILVVCPETRYPENHLSVRVFAELLGIPEDPATGSANGCLAAYLVNHQYYGTQAIDQRVEQGYEIGRPSLLLLKAEKLDDTIQVMVGGRSILVAKGDWLV
jgi:trans-2,3-dihydro-3-hydroxyanthranilate isomerase